MNRTIGVAVVVAGGLGLELMSAPLAGADQFDYVSDLDANGVAYTSVLDIIKVGKQICRIGRSVEDDEAMVDAIAKVVVDNGFTGKDASLIVSSAAVNMCPDIGPRVLE